MTTFTSCPSAARAAGSAPASGGAAPSGERLTGPLKFLVTGGDAFRKDRIKGASTTGIPADARHEWRRATAQAILGLQFAPASKDRLRIVSVRKQARAGERVQFRVYGLAPSESACMQVKGDFRRVKGKKSGDKIVRKLLLPTGNQRRVGLVKTSDDEARTTLRVRN